MDVDHEAILVGSAERGDERAWQQLYEAHVDAVYQFCLALASGRVDVAEETAQEVFVTAARRMNTFRPARGTFRTWLLGIARNRYMSLDAKQRRHRHLEARSSQRWQRQPGRDRDLGVHEALARLPACYRRALEAKYLRGMAVKDIAEIEGASVEAIESQLRRARSRFAEIYEQPQQ
jgi:RNA polymerase sigma-70 factor (ECF subfamily)